MHLIAEKEADAACWVDMLNSACRMAREGSTEETTFSAHSKAVKGQGTHASDAGLEPAADHSSSSDGGSTGSGRTTPTGDAWSDSTSVADISLKGESVESGALGYDGTVGHTEIELGFPSQSGMQAEGDSDAGNVSVSAAATTHAATAGATTLLTSADIPPAAAMNGTLAAQETAQAL